MSRAAAALAGGLDLLWSLLKDEAWNLAKELIRAHTNKTFRKGAAVVTRTSQGHASCKAEIRAETSHRNREGTAIKREKRKAKEENAKKLN